MRTIGLLPPGAGLTGALFTLLAVFSIVPANAQSSFSYLEMQEQAERDMKRMSADLADKESEKYYAIATSRNATAIDLCVQAGMVAQSYLQAERYSQYDRWKGKEKLDCRRAGVR